MASAPQQFSWWVSWVLQMVKGTKRRAKALDLESVLRWSSTTIQHQQCRKQTADLLQRRQRLSHSCFSLPASVFLKERSASEILFV